MTSWTVVAKESHVQRVNHVAPTIPCNYHNAEAQEIKQLYRSVFGALQQVAPLDAIERKLPRDLWDHEAPLRGPRAFSVRVYRAPDRPPGARFTKRKVPVRRS